MTGIFIGVGSNLGNPASKCSEAIRHLTACEGIDIVKVSSLYRTEPVGYVHQNWFVNCAVEIESSFDCETLMGHINEAELKTGEKAHFRWGPREIDIDLLLYGDEVYATGNLIIPHPLMHERRFILEPLCEIAPYVIHPLLHKTIQELLKSCRVPHRVEKING